MTPDHFEKLQRMYLKSNVNTHLYETTECKIELEKSTISLTISEKYFHALGAIHGSTIVEDVFVLTTSFNLNLIRPANQGKITAVGTVRYKSKNLLMAESTLFNESGKEIAFGSGSFAKSKVKLTEEIGYI